VNHKQRKAARRRAAQIRRNAETLERSRVAEAFHRVQVLSALQLLQRLANALELSVVIQQSAQQTKH
jgi:hypothetical protein